MLKFIVVALCAALALPAVAQQTAPPDLRVGVVTAKTQPLSIDMQLSFFQSTMESIIE